MQFSNRLPPYLKPSSLNQRLALCYDAIDLTQSNPTLCNFDYPSWEIAHTAVYEPHALGHPKARKILADFLHVQHVMLTASTSDAYAYLFKLLCNPNDWILVPSPSYPLFEHLAALEHVQCVTYPLYYHNQRWCLDVDALKAKITAQTKALVVVSPNNPTGSCFNTQEWQAVEALCVEYDLALIVDEVFLPYGFNRSLPSARKLIREPLTFVLEGLSKFAGLPHVKLGWISILGKQAEAALEHLEFIADTYLSVSSPIQNALPQWLEIAATMQTQIRARIQTNLKFLQSQLPAYVELLTVEGGWNAILRLPQIMSEEEWILQLAETAKVIVQPGYFYDFHYGCHCVLSLIVDEEHFRQGIQRMVEFLRIVLQPYYNDCHNSLV